MTSIHARLFPRLLLALPAALPPNHNMSHSTVFHSEALLSTICSYVPHWEVVWLESALALWVSSTFFAKHKTLQTPLMEFLLLRDKENKPLLQRLIHFLDADSFLQLAKAIPALRNQTFVQDLKLWNELGCPSCSTIYDYDDDDVLSPCVFH